MGYYTNAQQAALYFSRRRRRDALRSASLSLQLFMDEQEGIIIDPSQTDSLLKTRDGAYDPVTADGDEVNVAMDVRLWGGDSFLAYLSKQSEALTNGDFSAGDLSGWGDASIGTGSVAYVDGKGVISATNVSNYGALTQQVTAPANSVVVWEFELGESSDSALSYVVLTGSTVNGNFAENTSHQIVQYVETANPTITFRTSTNSGTLEVISCSARVIHGNHLGQSVATRWPLYKVSGGKHWLEGDGINDFMTSRFALAQPWTRISGIRQLAWGNGNNIFYAMDGFTGVLQQRTAEAKIAMYNTTYLQNDYAYSLDEDILIEELYDGVNSKMDGNGEVVTGTTGTTGGATGLAIFAASNGADPSNLRCYGVIMREDMDTDDIALAKAWIAERLP